MDAHPSKLCSPQAASDYRSFQSDFLQKGGFFMQDILKEYGPALITVVAILALIALVTFLIGKDGGSVVGKAFSNLITDFFSKATGQAGSTSGIIMLGGGF